MSCSELARRACLVLCTLFVSWPLRAEHVIGLGLEADSEEGKAVSLLGSFALRDATWLNLAASRSQSEGAPFNLTAAYLDAGIDHRFDPLGVRVGVSYWGDSERLDSFDIKGAVYWQGERGSLSLDAERREFDLVFLTPLTRERRRAEFSADGIGLHARVKLTDTVSAYANGMRYDYSRNLSVQPNIDVLRLFALSRLTTINGLLDDRVSGGIEFELGSRLLDVRASQWTTAVFGDRVDSLGVGLLTPAGRASDLELRLEFDDSDGAGRATLLSVFFYFYGD